MPLKTNTQLATAKTTNKKDDKGDISNIMDDAPLFAGLDDYIERQTVRLKAESTKSGQEEKKKRKVTAQTKQAASAEPMHQNRPKVQKAPSSETNSILLSVAEMCALLKISRATLVRMDKSGKLPGRIKLGGSVRFHRKTVETWLQSLISPHPAP